MNEYYLIAGMAVITFSIRYPMFALAGRLEFPARLVNALRFVPPAVLTAIIVPAILIPNGTQVNVSLSNPYLIGALVAFGTGWFSRSLLLTIIAGMAAFWGWHGVLALQILTR